jgi:putative transposase
MCRNLDVSKAGYYAWRAREQSARSKRDSELVSYIRTAHIQSRKLYGSPRIYAELRENGVKTSRKRVARLMRQHGIQGKKQRHFQVTTLSKHNYPIAPNLLNRQFKKERPNQAWVADITAVSTAEGWLYLAVVLDLFSRRVVGWSMSNKNDADLAINALKMATTSRTFAQSVIVHTDRGSVYACRAYVQYLEANNLVASMSRKRDCWDNAVAESFFSTLKVELKGRSLWKTRREARTAIFEYIEAWYNRRRRHSTLGYLSPMEFEECRHVA